jgi:hypothetical protein
VVIIAYGLLLQVLEQFDSPFHVHGCAGDIKTGFRSFFINCPGHPVAISIPYAVDFTQRLTHLIVALLNYLPVSEKFPAVVGI